jgi:Alw26I/Eco31I/Esp3I family type II restriction endonuclease
MEEIVSNDVYSDVPNARGPDGRINWQVSSGKTTSFYAYYEARWKWWERKADELQLPGAGNTRDRFSIAARVIHPTGYRPCRLCGERRNVGYFYLNHNSANRLNRLVGAVVFQRAMPVSDALELIDELEGDPVDVHDYLAKLFPERNAVFKEFGFTDAAFERSNHLRSRWLSPGYMANPPDRLDGFHDYCLYCRGENDPGRFDENMRSYTHDRRAFQWWAEGDWALADALYNAAGPGTCAVCGSVVDRVSPDHIGPLSCGFKQLPLFMPTCRSCNSSKNRRMRVDDVVRLIEYEDTTSASVASWQVRGLWDEYKARVGSDVEAAELSAAMRALQDGYLRALHSLLDAGQARFLSTLLSPDYALFKHEFVDLNPGALTFGEVTTDIEDTSHRRSLLARSVRIAFEELMRYVRKETTSRKIRKMFTEPSREIAAAAVAVATDLGDSPTDVKWAELVKHIADPDAFEEGVTAMRTAETADRDSEKDRALRALLEERFRHAGAEATLSI